MAKIVPQLVELATDPSVSTADLLRRSLVVASRTGADELVAWMSNELKGYGQEEVPAYRMIRGQLKVFNPYHGPIPVVGLPDDMSYILDHPLNQSVAELEKLSDSENGLKSYFPSEMESALMRLLGTDLRPNLEYSTVQMIGVLQHVRSQILDWALNLERQGVLGEGSTFSPAEKSIVQHNQYTFNNVSGQIQIDANHSSQVQSQTNAIDAVTLAKLVEVLKAGIERHDVRHEDLAELQAEVATLTAQASSPKPKPGIIRAALVSVKSVLENAGGSLIATQAQPYLTALLAAASA